MLNLCSSHLCVIKWWWIFVFLASLALFVSFKISGLPVFFYWDKSHWGIIWEKKSCWVRCWFQKRNLILFLFFPTSYQIITISLTSWIKKSWLQLDSGLAACQFVCGKKTKTEISFAFRTQKQLSDPRIQNSTKMVFLGVIIHVNISMHDNC